MRNILIALVLLVATGGTAYPGWFDETLRSVGESIGNRAAHGAGDSAYEGVKDEVKDTARDSDAEPKVKTKEGENRKPAKGKGDPSADSGSSVQESEGVYSKYDFVPGDKVIFFDDFSDTDVGEFPRKWHLNGPKYENNSVEVVEYQGKRFLRSVPGKNRQENATQYIRLNQKGDLPDKFTIEFDAVLEPLEEVAANNTYYNVLLYNNNDKQLHLIGNDMKAGVLEFSGKESRSLNSRSEPGKSDGRPHHVAISVNGRFVKAYIDNVRVINDPDGAKRPINLVGLSMGMTGESRSEKIMFTGFRLAAGGKDIKSALSTDGRIVTHGILFDTGKDAIKPESLPTLKMILGLLNDDPALKFSIEGHTDNQGGKGINQPLSEKRAAAVKNWLVGKGVEATRLKTKGFGDSKPIDRNDTPEARANNRRVEFVKF